MENAVRTRQKIIEETFNSLVHGLGAVAGITGLVLGVIFINSPGSFKAGFVVYVSSLILLMLMSTLYHALTFTKAYKVFRALDHGSIFLLIAGSYTPFIIYMFNGIWQGLILGFVWVMAVAGIALSASLVLPKSMKITNVLMYLVFGWFAVVLIPKMHMLPLPALTLLIIGGCLYTFGIIPFALKRPFAHTGWHLFVIAGACAHYFAVVQLV
jgi:hemolysin III